MLVQEGAQRSRSTCTPGYERDLLREGGTKNLLGPTESRPADLNALRRARGGATARMDVRQQAADALIDVLTPYLEDAVEYGVEAAGKGVVRLARWAKRKTTERRDTVANETADGRVGFVSEGVLEAEFLDADDAGGTDLEAAAVTNERRRVSSTTPCGYRGRMIRR